jgi:hypothetical protein
VHIVTKTEELKQEANERALLAARDAAFDESVHPHLRAWYAGLALYLDKKLRRVKVPANRPD